MSDRRIGISVLNCDFSHLEDELNEMKRNGVKNIHIDVMDTTFVPNISFGPEIVNVILRYDFEFDIHVMVNSPLDVISRFDLERVNLVSIHHEVCGKKEAIEYLRRKGVKIGLAINPETCVDDIGMSDVDMILIMTVQPGFGGQTLIEECLMKIERVREYGKKIGIDGGVSIDNIEKMIGVDYVVIGSGYFRSDDRREFMSMISKRFLNDSE